MEEHALLFWISMGLMSAMVGGAMRKILATHVSTGPTMAAWLGVTMLVERLSSLGLPAVLALAALGAVCLLVPYWSPPVAPLPTEGRAVFITGCDSGFGKSAAQKLDALGFEVFASVLDLSGEGAQELQRVCSSRLTLIQMDITQAQDIQQALARTKAKLGLRGEQPFPCLAAYGASKAALNLFINTLRHELEPWGVKVSTILPASFKTGQSSNSEYWELQYKHLLQNLPPALLEEYGEEYMLETKQLFQQHAKMANEDLSPVIDTILDALVSPRPKVRYYAGPGVGLMYFIHSYFPMSLSDRFLQRLFVKKKVLPRALQKHGSNSSDSHNNNNIDKVGE
ncbi:11-beta-hydroxysteroid dehydrogenase type 2 isoform X2 [Paramormyrops kingsleyae]|uniref:11-beta-hydroxysteroid dehydrogenase type 2 isoform X2 n=1 Tax=Paramormyrops kingsleyae TaxID=1676925 RepID=UPI003B975C9E